MGLPTGVHHLAICTNRALMAMSDEDVTKRMSESTPSVAHAGSLRGSG